MENKEKPRAETRGNRQRVVLENLFQKPSYNKTADYAILKKISRSNEHPIVCALAKGLAQQIEEKERGGVAA